MKTCKTCKVEKELEEFYKNGKSKDGRNSYCKECDKAAAKKRFEIIRADPELWAKEIERSCKYMKERRERNKLKKHKDEILYNRGNQTGDRDED